MELCQPLNYEEFLTTKMHVSMNKGMYANSHLCENKIYDWMTGCQNGARVNAAVEVQLPCDHRFVGPTFPALQTIRLKSYHHVTVLGWVKRWGEQPIPHSPWGSHSLFPSLEGGHHWHPNSRKGKHSLEGSGESDLALVDFILRVWAELSHRAAPVYS